MSTGPRSRSVIPHSVGRAAAGRKGPAKSKAKKNAGRGGNGITGTSTCGAREEDPEVLAAAAILISMSRSAWQPNKGLDLTV